MPIRAKILAAIKAEVQNDPNNVGYAGKTRAQILALLNGPTPRQRVETYSDPSPMNRILSGLANAPNAADIADLTAAQKVV